MNKIEPVIGISAVLKKTGKAIDPVKKLAVQPQRDFSEEMASVLERGSEQSGSISPPEQLLLKYDKARKETFDKRLKKGAENGGEAIKNTPKQDAREQLPDYLGRNVFFTA